MALPRQFRSQRPADVTATNNQNAHDQTITDSPVARRWKLPAVVEKFFVSLRSMCWMLSVAMTD